jgi:DNA-binding XRE family transcriptional regulator
MTKKQCIDALNRELRYALRTYHADSGMSQEELAAMMLITPRACSGLENEEYGFSVFSMIALLAILPMPKRVALIAKLCSMITQMHKEAA